MHPLMCVYAGVDGDLLECLDAAVSEARLLFLSGCTPQQLVPMGEAAVLRNDV